MPLFGLADQVALAHILGDDHGVRQERDPEDWRIDTSSSDVGKQPFAATEVVEARNAEKHSDESPGNDQVPRRGTGSEHHRANSADDAGNRIQAVKNAETVGNDTVRIDDW